MMTLLHEDFYDMDLLGPPDINDIISEAFNVDLYIREEASEVKKANFLQKIWGIIKKLIGMVKARVGQIFHAFKSIFVTRKIEDKTLDQIAEAVLGDTPAPSTKHLQFRYEDDKQVSINIMSAAAKYWMDTPTIPGKDKGDRPYTWFVLLVMQIIKKPYLLDPIIEMLENLNESKGKINFPLDRARNAINTIYANTITGAKFTIRLEEWSVLNEKVVKLNHLVTIVDADSMGQVNLRTDDSGAALSGEWAKTLNEMASLVSKLQRGVNLIGDSMRQMYELDGKYHDKINHENYKTLLPKFVKTCIETNIPGKYIIHAVRQICDISINSDVKDKSVKASTKQTFKGNGRFIIFPSHASLDGKVIKIAYNGLGTRANAKEIQIFNHVKDIGPIREKIYDVYDEVGDPEYHVILTQRAAPIDRYDGADDWNKAMKELCRQAGLKYFIRTNYGGFGTIPTGQTVSVDFGGVFRFDK